MLLNKHLNFFGKTTLAIVLVFSLNHGIQAQTSVSTGGAVGITSTSTTAPLDAGSSVPGAAPTGSNANSLLLSNTLQNNIAQQAAAKASSKNGPDAPADATARPPVRTSGPNQFQRFVQETTGRFLPVYGSDLFNSPQAYATNTAAPAPDNYILGPGDEVSLQVSGPQDFSTNLVIDRNGQINLPKIGPVTLAGVAVKDLESHLTQQLSKVFTNFKASATLGRLRGIQVYVVGQALQPGTFQLSSLSTLVNALFASGGPSANGSMRAIELKRGGKTITTIDLYDFIAKGDKSKDLPLLAGDVIVIPPVGSRVAITGAFDQAAIFELNFGNTTIGDVLNLGGGVPTLATTQKALLERITRTSNPPRQVQEIVLDASGLNQPLKDGDVLTLLGISPAFGNAVTLQGTVAAPLRYRWFEGMCLLDLIPERDALITSDYYRRKNLLVQNAEAAKGAGGNVSNQIRGMVDQINWEYAVIERLDRNTLSTQLIPFNLGKAVLQKDPAHNLPLLAGDVVTILSQSDLRVPQMRQSRLVRVEGEVAVPGVYQTQPGETLPKFLKRIGGLTPQAYLFGTELSRESVKLRQQENLDSLIRRLEAQSLSQQSSLVANRTSTNNGIDQTSTILQVQQVQLRAQIERLKSFKSNGRMALELDPRGQTLAALPDLPLEDGDRIMIPSTPGFVSAFGSVNNENVFIYKTGKTVADVIRSAGLTEDAEPGQAFVLRADGSIVARNSNTWFGGNFESLALMPGDTLVVPAMMDRETRYNTIVRGFKDWTQILGNLGLGIAAFRSMGY